jgi:hypothetical protein
LPPFEDRGSGSHFAILSRHQPATQKSCNTSAFSVQGLSAGVIATSRTPLWLAARSEYRDRHPSRG